ncbi:MAG: ABC transporter ATP-binding protein, partial [Actinomycetota bacterium]
FVGAFIGSPSMNLYESTLSVGDHGGTMTLGSQSLSFGDELLEARPALRGYDGKKVIMGIRPEDFEDASLVDDDTTGRQIRSSVALTEALGSEIMVHFDLDAPTVDSGDPDAASDEGAKAVGRFNPRSRVRIGDDVTIAVTTENLHFFDADTRNAIWT